MSKIYLSNTICILISGYAGSGKSTLAELLNTQFKKSGFSCIRGSFAKRVKEIAAEMGWQGEKDDKGRELLQNIGETGRKYSPYLWADSLHYYFQYTEGFTHDIVIVDDWRYPNEREFFEAFFDGPLYQVFTVRIDSPNGGLKNELALHESETSLPTEDDGKYYYYYVHNNCKLEDLEKIAEDLANNIIKDAKKY